MHAAVKEAVPSSRVLKSDYVLENNAIDYMTVFTSSQRHPQMQLASRCITDLDTLILDSSQHHL